MAAKDSHDGGIVCLRSSWTAVCYHCTWSSVQKNESAATVKMRKHLADKHGISTLQRIAFME